ncbi:MAG: PD-(D/E)XK nuclease family protein [Candidatus Dadabacteria bacterium]|nr:MAG: PD-(D/E)XK nuclease family protein [Candidatus Dadabacteria bacterium]
MNIKCVYCGYKRPILESTVNYLTEQLRSNLLDLSDTLVVVPGGRAGRRLKERLALYARDNNIVLIPPQIKTAGLFPEELYKTGYPLATQQESLLAWAEALRGLDSKSLVLLAGEGSERAGISELIPMARTVSSLWRELSGAGLDFKSAGERINALGGAPPDPRWEILEEVFSEYLSVLHKNSLEDRDLARKAALAEKNLHFDGKIVLSSVRDLTFIQKEMLRALDSPVASLVFAEESEKAGFDELGCIKPEYWAEYDLNISLDNILCAADPYDQALLAIDALQKFSSGTDCSEVIIGYTDARSFKYFDTVFNEANLKLHDPAGRPLSETRPLQLLKKLYAVSRGYRAHDIYDLVRFPEFENYLNEELALKRNAKVSVLSLLDSFQMERLQALLDEKSSFNGFAAEIVREIVSVIKELLKPFSTGKYEMAEWIPAVQELLLTIYTNPGEYEKELRAISGLCDSLAESLTGTELGGADALALIAAFSEDHSLAYDLHADDIEALGWLELQHEDVPAMIVCGLNEEYVPQSVNGDQFLTESVRKQLGLTDNERRYARDKFILASLVKSLDQIALLYCRSAFDGTPLLPSRLIAKGEGDLTARVKKLYLEELPFRVAGREEAPPELRTWEIPPAVHPAQPVSRIPVTAFRSYIECPYRFYLRHVLNLESADDTVQEMDARVFGTLGHSVLAEFGKSAAASETRYALIVEALSEILDRKFKDNFGETPLAALLIQREQLRARLKKFAAWQSMRAAEGYIIRHTEFEPEKSFTIETEKGKVEISGRIDRIDFNPETNSWQVFDYKFSESIKEPRKSHIQKGEWIDLQLPLYYWMLREAGFEGKIKTGYISPAATGKAEEICTLADWSEDELKSALELASAIVTSVLEGKFKPAAARLRFPTDFDLLFDGAGFVAEGAHGS